MRSDHNYPNALSSGATADRASVCSEFGGLGLFIQVCKTHCACKDSERCKSTSLISAQLQCA